MGICKAIFKATLFAPNTGQTAAVAAFDGRGRTRRWVGGQEHCLFSSRSINQMIMKLQRFRVRHRLSCVIGPVWPVGAGCYSQAALPMPLSQNRCMYSVRHPIVLNILSRKFPQASSNTL